MDNEQVTAPVKAPRQPAIVLKNADALLLLVVGGLVSWLYALCFSGIPVFPQISFTVFCPVAFVALTFALRRMGRLKNKKALLWGIPIAIVASFNGIFHQNLFTYGNVLLMHGLFALFILNASQEQPRPLFNPTGCVMVLRLILGHWLAFIDVTHFLRKQRKASPQTRLLGKILIGILLAVPVLLIIVGLLVSADPVFGKFTEDFLNSTLFTFDSANLGFCITFVVVWIYLVGYVCHSKIILESQKFISLYAPRVDVAIAAAFLCMVNVVFVLFTIIQVAYLFNGGFLRLPEGMVYAQYAREGFFQLLFVTVINFSVIIVFLGWMKEVKNSKLLRFLLLALCFFTGVLIASSFYRMGLYIDVYGHTTLRLWVVTFLVMEVVLLGVTVLKLFVEHVPFIRWFAIAGLIFYLAVNYTGSDYFATRLNVQLFTAGKLEVLDIDSVGVDGLALIKPLLQDKIYVCYDYTLSRRVDGIHDSREQRYTDFTQRLTTNEKIWQNWSYLKRTLY